MKSLSRREQIYLGVFALALLWGIWNFRASLGFGPSTTPAAATQTGAPPPAATATAPAAGTTASPAVVRKAGSSGAYSAPDWGSDPMHRRWRSTNTVAAAPARRKTGSPLRLTAVVVREDARYAIINGRVMRVGDQIEGRRVQSIEPSGVILDEKGIEVRLSL